MARKRKVPTRKRRALRWLTVLTALVVLSAVLDIYYLFPSQALAYLDSREGLTDTETVHSTWDGLRRLYLRRCDSGFYFTSLEFEPFMGWIPLRSSFLTWKDSPLWGVDIVCEDGEARVALFGFVPDGEAPPVFSVRTGDANSLLGAASTVEPEIAQFTPQAGLPGEGGNFCLAVLRYPIPQGGYANLYIQTGETWVRLYRQSISQS